MITTFSDLNKNLGVLTDNGVVTQLTFDGTDFWATGKVEGADAVTKKLGNISDYSFNDMVNVYNLYYDTNTNTKTVTLEADGYYLMYLNTATLDTTVTLTGAILLKESEAVFHMDLVQGLYYFKTTNDTVEITVSDEYISTVGIWKVG